MRGPGHRSKPTWPSLPSYCRVRPDEGTGESALDLDIYFPPVIASPAAAENISIPTFNFSQSPEGTHQNGRQRKTELTVASRRDLSNTGQILTLSVVFNVDDPRHGGGRGMRDRGKICQTTEREQAPEPCLITVARQVQETPDTIGQVPGRDNFGVVLIADCRWCASNLQCLPSRAIGGGGNCRAISTL